MSSNSEAIINGIYEKWLGCLPDDCDPDGMMAKIKQQAAEIEQLKTNNGKLSATIELRDKEIERLKEENTEEGRCTWGQEDQYDADENAWDTDCGESFYFMFDGPVANRFKACPYCGKKIIEKPYVADKDGE